MKSSHYVDEGVRVVRLQNIGSGHFDDRDRAFISPEHFEKLQKHTCEAGDVLVATLGDPILRAAIQPESLPVALNKADCIQLRCDPERASPEYVTHYLNSSVAQAHAAGLAHGQTRPRVNLTQLRRLPVPLPPIEEQRRIAAVLDAADALRVKRRQAIAKLDTLTQAIFIDMFGDPILNPTGWPLVAFETQVDGIRYGTGSPPPYIESGGVPFVRATDIKHGRIRQEGMKAISETAAKKLDKCILRTGDLIVVRSGVNTGDCAIVPQRLDGARVAYDMIVSLPAESARFYHFLLDSSFGRQIVEPLTRRAAQPHLNAKQLRSLQVIAPPSSMQHEFADQLNKVADKRSKFESQRARLDNLFGSLQQRAFRGEL